MDPKTLQGSRICFVLTGQGLTAYGNTAALRSLARWLGWLADSDPSAHYECHTTLALQENNVVLDESLPRSVWLLAEPALSKALRDSVAQIDTEPGTVPAPFEVTFMQVVDGELDVMAQFQSSGELPSNWMK